MEKICKGQIYKAETKQFQTRKGFALSVRLNLLKRKSCEGCEECGWILDSLGEISDDIWPVLDIETAEDGKLYTLVPAKEHRDWETGLIDEWYLRLVEVKETA